jgi:hypothetical protein
VRQHLTGVGWMQTLQHMLQGSGEREVVWAVTSSGAERLPEWGTAEHVPAAELVRRQGIRPIKSTDELVRLGTFESDEELDEFLTDLYASRHTGMA